MPYKSASIGEVPDHWDVAPLRDFIDLITYGFTNPMPDAEDGPWKLTAKDIVGGRIQYSTARRTTVHAFTALLTDKSRPKVGDVLLTKDGSIGRVAVVDRDNICINQSVALLRPNQRILPRYLAFLLRSPFYQARMEGDSDGSTIKHIYITRVDKMEVAVPPVDEQVEQLAVLGGIDDRIALLRETNATLEAIAQALFKSWFVDFDPVRAKAEGRDPEGVPPEVADLFPSEFEDSELGEIPKGWRVGRLGDVLKQRVERTKPSSQTEQLPYVPIECISSKSVFLVESRPGVEAQSSLTLFREGDIVFGAMRPYFHKVCLAPFDGVTRTTAFVLSPIKPEMAMFALFQMFDDRTIEFATNHSEGSTIPYAKWAGSMENMSIVVPPDDVAAAFGEIVDGLMRRGIQNTEQSQSLAELRDTLLPRLMSGKLRIPEIQEAIEEAAA